MRKALLPLMIAGACLPGFALADDSAEGWKSELELSYLMKRGNSKSDTMAGKFKADRDGVRFRHAATVEGANTSSRDSGGVDEKTAERYFGSYKLDVKLAENSANYVFGVATYEKDLFSGFHYQASVAAGLGRRWIDNGTHTLDTEVGPGYRVLCHDVPAASYNDCSKADEDSYITRVGLKYEWKISDTASFSEIISSEIADDATTTRAETALTSQIRGNLSLRLSHLLKHNSEVPVGKRNSDQEMRVGLVYSF